MTATPRELAHAAELATSLAELNNAALLARPYVASSASHARTANMLELAAAHDATLERLDAAIADAGDVLERCSS